MDILPPALQDISALGHEFPPLRDVTQLWKISVLRSDNVVWCTILAYLKSFSPISNQEFKNHLKLLLGNSKVGKTFISHLKNCNLFLGEDARLYEEVFRDLISPFTEKIKSFFSEQKTMQLFSSKFFISFKTFEQKFSNFSLFPSKEIKAAATLLSHDIVVISYTKRLSRIEVEGILLFPAVSDVKNFEFTQTLTIKPNLDKCILLFHTSIKNRNCFSIGLRKDVGLDMQKSALREILKSQKILSDKRIKRIRSLQDIGDNFLIALIKNSYENCIPSLLQSAYISKKLYSAGFKIDPRTKNKHGLNALSYALCLENSYCLFFLYEFAANLCHTGENSIRHPDLLIVDNLMSLKECITELKEVKYTTVQDISRCQARIEELLKLNSFQIIICQHLNEAHKEFGEASQEVLKRKNIILRILKTYDDYFHWNTSGTDPEYGLSCLKENLNHIDYLDNLDFYCAILFFDNFFLLKEKLKLEKCLYLKTESRIFCKLFCTKFFRYCEEISPSELLTFRLTTWQMREELLKAVRHFCKCVEKRKICHDNLRTCVPEEEVKTLTNLPELYDEFFLNRLKTYLNIATNITIKDQKSILVIERALQVIGESVKDRLKIESMQNVIALGLPKELVIDLKRIRNQLSKLKLEQIPWRSSAENNIELFESVRSELKSLCSVLQPVFANHKHRLERFIYLQIIKAINKAAKEQVSEKYASCLKEMFSSSDEKSNNVSNDEQSCKFQRQWEEHLKSIYFSVQREIKEPKPVLMKGSTIRYKYILKNIFLSVRNKLNNIKTKKHNNDDFKNLLNEYFLPLECFMDFITTDDFLNNFRRTFLKKVKARRSFCQIKKRKKIKKSSKDDLSSDCGLFQENIYNQVSKVNQTNDHECQTIESTIENTDNSGISCESDSSSSKMSENFLLKRNENHSTIKPLNSAQDQNKVHERDPEISNLISKAEKILTDYHTIYENLFQNAYHIVKKNIMPCFPNIHNLRKILFGQAYLKEKDKKKILQDVASTKKAVRQLKDTVYDMKLTSDEVKSQLLILRFKEKDWSEITKDYQLDHKNFLSHIEPISELLAELEYVMDQNEMKTKQYKKFCDKLNLSEESKKILTRIVIGYKVQIPGDPLRFLSNRIKLLKHILIEEQKDVSVLWEEISNEKSKDYTYLCEKFLQLYLKEPEVRLSVETLLFDCMNLLKNENLQALLKKSSNLFNGINLRNVLAHGDPLLEVLSHLLEPNDLASELVKKILQLILDDEVIDMMLQICCEAKADYTQFMRIMNDETGEYKNSCDYIRQSENWKEYAKLIPSK